MSWVEIVGLLYLVIGLLLAAVIYHVLTGGIDKWAEPNICPEHGDDCETERTKRELGDVLDKLSMVRASPQGRFAVAVLTAIACVAASLAWPALLAFLIVRSRQRG